MNCRSCRFSNSTSRLMVVGIVTLSGCEVAALAGSSSVSSVKYRGSVDRSSGLSSGSGSCVTITPTSFAGWPFAGKVAPVTGPMINPSNPPVAFAASSMLRLGYSRSLARVFPEASAARSLLNQAISCSAAPRSNGSIVARSCSSLSRHLARAALLVMPQAVHQRSRSVASRPHSGPP